MEEGLGVDGEGRILTEGDEDDIGAVVDGRLEVHEDINDGTLCRLADLVTATMRHIHTQMKPDINLHLQSLP